MQEIEESDRGHGAVGSERANYGRERRGQGSDRQRRFTAAAVARTNRW